MGVHGTFCQLCGLPTGHDHYVPTAGGMLKIYRGSAGPGGGHTWEANEKPFLFGPEHAWLKRAVVLPWNEERVIHGEIEDGVLEGVMVFEGGDDGLAFHHACWEIEGSPGSTGPAFRANGTHAWALVEGYHEQLFDFASLVADGKAWMLEEPKPGTRSRARIDAMRTIPEVSEVKDVVEAIKADRDWGTLTVHDDRGRKAILRARMHTFDHLDKAGYAQLVRVTRFYEEPRLPGAEEMEELEAYEIALKTAVERDAQAGLIFVGIGAGRAEYFIYGKDAAATQSIVTAVPGTSAAKVESREDPQWQIARDVLMAFRA